VFFALSLISVKETRFNTIVKKTLEGHGYGYKISDVAGGQAQRRPFDGIGIYEGRLVFWEGKAMKGVYAFNLKEVFEGTRGHQMETFDTFSQVSNPPELWVILCCFVPRKSQVYTFPYSTLKEAYEKDNLTSVTQQMLQALPYTGISKDRVKAFEPITIETLRRSANG